MERFQAARITLWIGAFLPIIYSVERSVEAVGTIGPLEVTRGGGPLVAFLLSYLISPSSVRRLRSGMAEFWLLIFLAVATLSSLWSYSPQSTVLKVIPLIFAYLCVMRLTSMYSSAGQVVHALVTVSHILLLSAGLQFLLYRDTLLATDESAISRFASVVPSISPNLLGLVIGIAIAGILFKVGPAWSYRTQVGPLLIILYFVMLIGGRSRFVTAVAILLTIGAIIYVMRLSPIFTAVAWFVGVGILISIWIVWESPAFQTGIVEFITRGQDVRSIRTLTGRTVIWESAVLAIQENPIFGYGYYAGHRLALSAMFPLFEAYSNIDSTWIETWVNVGLVGLIPLILFAISGAVRVLKHKFEESRNIRWLASGIVVAVIALAFINPGIQSPTSTMVIFAVVVFATRRREQLIIPRKVSPSVV